MTNEGQRPLSFIINCFQILSARQIQIESNRSSHTFIMTPVQHLNQPTPLIPDHMSNVLIDHHGEQQSEWEQTVDSQRLVDAMSFTCLSRLDHHWAGLQNSDQLILFARHSMLTTKTPTLHVNSSSIHLVSSLTDLDLRVISNLTLDRSEHMAMDPQDQSHGGRSFCPEHGNSGGSPWPETHSVRPTPNKNDNKEMDPDDSIHSNHDQPARSMMIPSENAPACDQSTTLENCNSGRNDPNCSAINHALEETKIDKLLSTILKFEQKVDALESHTSASIESPNPSGCVKDIPPSPSKTASDAGTHPESCLLTCQANNAQGFLNWKQLPQDVNDQMKVREDNRTVQTCSSLTKFQNGLAKDPVTEDQKE